METNYNTASRNTDCLIIDILCNEFGREKVKQALTFKKHYRSFKKENYSLVSDSFNNLSYQWQMGRSREYLESLAVEVQYSLICYLAENYIYDKPYASYDSLADNHWE